MYHQSLTLSLSTITHIFIPSSQKLDEQLNHLHDGQIEFPEFVSILTTKTIANERETNYLQIFQSLDEQNDGFLTKEELMNGLEMISKEEEMLYYSSFKDMDEEALNNALMEVNRDALSGEERWKYSDFVKALRLHGILP